MALAVYRGVRTRQHHGPKENPAQGQGQFQSKWRVTRK
jgi:hypothetical protein